MRTYTREFPGKKRKKKKGRGTLKQHTRITHHPLLQNVVNQGWFGSQIISAHCSRKWVITRVNVILTAGLLSEARTRSSQSPTEAREGQYFINFPLA